MGSAGGVSTELERETRIQWKGGAARLFYGRCDDCGRVNDDDGRALLVARQAGCRKFQCLGCYSLKPTGLAARRRR
jgi:hypothetical protein